MARAFVLIPHERRQSGSRRRTFAMTDPEAPHEIPVKYPEDPGGPVVMTTMKAISWLIGYTTALVLVVMGAFKFLVASEVKDLRLELLRDYARRSDIITRTEFDQTIREVNRRLDQPVSISREADTRLKTVEGRVDRNDGRILALENRSKR